MAGARNPQDTVRGDDNEGTYGKLFSSHRQQTPGFCARFLCRQQWHGHGPCGRPPLPPHVPTLPAFWCGAPGDFAAVVTAKQWLKDMCDCCCRYLAQLLVCLSQPTCFVWQVTLSGPTYLLGLCYAALFSCLDRLGGPF